MPIMEISVVPIGTETSSVSSFVAEALKVLQKEPDIEYELSSMGTMIQAADIETLFRVAAKMHKALFTDGVQRVYTIIKIDDRADRKASMQDKIKSVQKKLAEQ